MLRDPMVRDDNTNDEAASNEQEEIKSPATSNKIVQPLHVETEKEDGTTSQPEEKVEAESDDTEKTTATSSHDGSESAIINAVIDSSSKDKNTTKQVVSDEDERIAELIRSKKYFVHVSNAHGSRLMAYSTIIVLIFGIVLFFYYADTQGWITLSL